MMPHRTSARGSEPQEQGCGTVSIWGARARLRIRRAGVDRCPPENTAGRFRPWTGCAGLSPPPHLSPGSRESPETRPSGARPSRARRSPAAASAATPARGPPLARLPQATLAAAGSFPHLPEGQTWGPLPGMADLAGKRRAAGGARTTAATSALPRGAAPARAPSLPPGRGPGAPSPGLHNSHPARARTRLNRVAQPTCSLF